MPLLQNSCEHLCLYIEAFFHSRKPVPFDGSAWDRVKTAVMEKAVRAKLAADPNLSALLLSTDPHPLLSISNDTVWGFHAALGGQNLLAEIWMQIRTELKEAMARQAAVPSAPSAPSASSLSSFSVPSFSSPSSAVCVDPLYDLDAALKASLLLGPLEFKDGQYNVDIYIYLHTYSNTC